ncbi:arylsulfatase A family protein [Halovivax ruber XH-70]|uniref:Arylsulfatase A family protein n=1 Tax=Halovivax ruber (strain DSM 18193 / JCM 13892 / XH-70) TaxID=797302 RepID=L0I9X3_HALRX|nr:sulfatase [Halovivax ruber]AGB14752.1 arylsulfatase A family protein [Halovivax ruber XH-70]
MTTHGDSADDEERHGNGRSDLQETDRPNVCLVVLDTARASDVDAATMPTLTQLGDEGTRFERAFSTAPWTVPSHASLFTGTYTSEHGTHGGHQVLDDRLRTLPEAFAAAGYETVGVSNNTWITAEFGFDRGFDDLRRGWQYRQSDTDMGTVVRGECLSEKLRAARERLFEGNPLVNLANVVYSEFLQPAGDDGAARSVDWIDSWLRRRSTDEPFFCFCNLIEPHVVYDPPQSSAEAFLPSGVSHEDARAIRQDPRAFDCGEYSLDEEDFAALRGLYRGSLAYADAQLARLRESLEAAGALENTIVVVCGDHGEHVGERGFFGHQYNLYDTLLHVPLVVHGGPFTDGTSRRDLVQLLDLPETLLDVTGVSDPALRAQGAGRSLHPGADESPRDAVFAEYVAPQPSIERLEARFGEVPDRVRAFDRRLRAIRTTEYKYVEGSDGFRRLHYLPTDPDERRDIAAENPSVVADLSARLDAQLASVDHTPQTEPVAMSDGTKQRLADLGYR